MLYAIMAEDKPGALENRLAIRPEHLEHLKSLGDKLVFAGALLDTSDKPSGSLVVIEAESLEEAQQLAAADPFVKQGVFASYQVRRWNWTLNNPTGRGQ